MGRTSYDERAVAALKKRTLVSTLLIFIAMPLTIAASILWLDSSKYMIISFVIVIYTIIPFFMIFEGRKPKAREIVLLSVITAITSAAQIFFHVTIPIQIETALVVVAGIALGPEAGFMVGSLSRFICNFYLGQGPWTPWQMFCYGIVGFLAGLTFSKAIVKNRFEETENAVQGKVIKEEKLSRRFRIIMGPVLSIFACEALAYVTYLFVPAKDEIFWGWRVYFAGAIGIILGALLQRKRLPIDNITMSVFTLFTTVIIYGGIMNIGAMFMSMGIPGSDISFNTMRTLYISGLPYDLYHGITAAIAIFIIGQPMITKIERIKIKYGIYR